MVWMRVILERMGVRTRVIHLIQVQVLFPPFFSHETGLNVPGHDINLKNDGFLLVYFFSVTFFRVLKIKTPG